MAWLSTITRREAFRLARRMSTRREELGIESAERGGDNPMMSVDERLAVGGVLHGLASVDRQLIALRYAHDMTYGQAAQVLGLPEGTAKVRLHRAHKRLAAALRESR